MCIQFHLINSIKSNVPKTRKRVFHRKIWNCLWKQCTTFRGNTWRISWIVKKKFPSIVVAFFVLGKLSKNYRYQKFDLSTTPSKQWGSLIIGQLCHLDQSSYFLVQNPFQNTYNHILRWNAHKKITKKWL